jgi:cholesterol transport system auxiliary component
MTHRIGSMMVVALCASGIALPTSACALLSKSEVVDVRYFSPERVRPQRTREDPVGGPGTAALRTPLQVRLGRVSSGPNLRERIAYRDATYELGYYDDFRWTERPETYVRRELGRSLFEANGILRVLGGAAPTLDVEVIAFDDLRLKTGRAVRVQLRVILYEDNAVLFEDTLTTDRPVPGEKPPIEDVVATMAIALDAAVGQVALRVGKALTTRGSATATDSAP